MQLANNAEKKLIEERATLSQLQSDILLSRVSLEENREELNKAQVRDLETQSIALELVTLRTKKNSAVSQWQLRWKGGFPWPAPEGTQKKTGANLHLAKYQVETKPQNSRTEQKVKKESTESELPNTQTKTILQKELIEAQKLLSGAEVPQLQTSTQGGTQTPRFKSPIKAVLIGEEVERLSENDPQEWLRDLKGIFCLLLARAIGVRCPITLKSDSHIAYIDHHRKQLVLPLIDAFLIKHCWELISIKDAKSDASHLRRFRDNYSFGVEMAH